MGVSAAPVDWADVWADRIAGSWRGPLGATQHQKSPIVKPLTCHPCPSRGFHCRIRHHRHPFPRAFWIVTEQDQGEPDTCVTRHIILDPGNLLTGSAKTASRRDDAARSFLETVSSHPADDVVDLG